MLWVAIRAMLARHPAAKFVVYTGDVDAAPDQIVERIRYNGYWDRVLIGYYDYHLMTLLFACFISFQHKKRELEII